MFSYLAFKGLSWNNFSQTLFSPIIYTAWNKAVTAWGEFFYLKAGTGQLDRGYGIFASTPEEARRYTPEIYLVAPDPNHRIAVGTLGWRAEAAMVVAHVTSEEDAAKQIFSAHYAGYPQVIGILAWAARYEEPKESFRFLQDILRNCQDNKVLQVVADSAASIGEEGLPILEQLSASDNMWVRMKVIDACKRPVEYVRPLLQRFVESAERPVRTYAAYVCSVHGPAALPWLEKLAHDDNYHVRLTVARSIRYLGDAAIPILKKLRHDKEEHVRLEALKSLRAVKKSAKKER
jgi:hypothetical protein